MAAVRHWHYTAAILFQDWNTVSCKTSLEHVSDLREQKPIFPILKKAYLLSHLEKYQSNYVVQIVTFFTNSVTFKTKF